MCFNFQIICSRFNEDVELCSVGEDSYTYMPCKCMGTIICFKSKVKFQDYTSTYHTENYNPSGMGRVGWILKNSFSLFSVTH